METPSDFAARRGGMEESPTSPRPRAEGGPHSEEQGATTSRSSGGAARSMPQLPVLQSLHRHPAAGRCGAASASATGTWPGTARTKLR